MDSILVLDLDIRRAIANKEVVISVFLDIEKAYDTVWKEGLIIKLYDAGVRGRMLNWINAFLKERTIQVKVDGSLSSKENVENGTPQGSVISPVLFNVMINDIF
ncbi:MAG: reverse transcriptase domain-containing protein, partial [Anaerovoracaceae bacterium]